jgi:putative SOS response-associated peptidase YedK
VQRRFGGRPPRDGSGIAQTDFTSVATCTQATCVCTPCAYHDWRTVGKQKLPTLFRPASGLFGFAGLWETWHGEKEPLDTFAILTTDANATVAATHDRMPDGSPASRAR